MSYNEIENSRYEISSIYVVIHMYVYCIINDVLFYIVVTIMTEPMNVTVCLSQSTTANFTCVVNGGSRNITTAGWQILDVDIYILVTGRARHILDPKTTSTNTDTILTETLTITDVSLSDNGAKYRCRPVDDVISDVVTLTVIGKIICIYVYVCVCDV